MASKVSFAIEGIPVFLGDSTTVDMAGAAHALVYGTASTAQTEVVGVEVRVDANATGGGTSGQTLTLPTAAGAAGRTLLIINAGGEIVTCSDTQSTKIFPDAAVRFHCKEGFWFREGGPCQIAGTITVTSGQSTGTESVGAGLNGLPVFCAMAAADGSLFIKSQIIATGTLTVTLSGNATADRTVYYHIVGN